MHGFSVVSTCGSSWSLPEILIGIGVLAALLLTAILFFSFRLPSLPPTALTPKELQGEVLKVRKSIAAPTAKLISSLATAAVGIVVYRGIVAAALVPVDALVTAAACAWFVGQGLHRRRRTSLPAPRL